jgi:hypothetical protein
MDITPKSLALMAAMAVLAVPLVAAASDGTSNAANKTSAAGSTLAILGDEVTGGLVSASETVLSTTIKTSPPQDLLFAVTLECALWSTVQTVGNDISESTSRVTITVLFDGVEVPVSAGDDDGSVVFCDRVHRQTTEDFDDENATIETYLATRSANAFNWVLPDVGGGEHAIDVVATLDGEATDNAVARAGVGHRTLIVEPIHMAQGATVDDGLSDDGGLSAASEPVEMGEAPAEPSTSILDRFLDAFGF